MTKEWSTLVLERPADESQRYTVQPPTGGAVLEGAQTFDSAEAYPV